MTREERRLKDPAISEFAVLCCSVLCSVFLLCFVVLGLILAVLLLSSFAFILLSLFVILYVTKMLRMELMTVVVCHRFVPRDSAADREGDGFEAAEGDVL